ncbi:glycosyltransferase family 4 protein [Pantoea deleyi]|uniref:glycosyltransferase family 4 protein n=1 Tax=Pantoea deleyi TaxID=470932 RepID=UPI0035D42546
MINAKKKICLIGHECGYYKGQGGIATYIEHTAKGFSKLGYEVHTIFLHGSDLDDPAITCWKIKDNFSIFKNSKAIDDVLSQIKPDFVEVTDFIGLASYTLAKRAINGLDYSCRFITNNHTGIREVWEWGTALNFMECAPPWMIEMYQYERAQSILSDANYSTSHFLADYLSNLHDTKVHTCPSYYPLAEQTIPPVRDKNNTIEILSLGRFELRKKQELLILAACELMVEGYDLHVTLIGNSGDDFYDRRDYMDTCYGLIPLKLKNKFSFYDFIPYKELQKQYKNYDLFVIPSPYENFPNTALEAINYGLIVAGSKTSGIADMSGPAAEKLCFEKNSVDSIKKMLTGFSSMSREEKEEIRKVQRESLKTLVSFESAIVNRVSQYENIEIKSTPVRPQRELCLFITMRDDARLEFLVLGDKKIHVDSNEAYQLINAAEYMIILPDDNVNDLNLEKNYFPEKNIISATSHHHPYGTVLDINKSRKAFSQIIINVADISVNKHVKTSRLIAEILFSCKDVVFFKEESSRVEKGIGIDLMYELDLLRYKYNG